MTKGYYIRENQNGHFVVYSRLQRTSKYNGFKPRAITIHATRDAAQKQIDKWNNDGLGS